MSAQFDPNAQAPASGKEKKEENFNAVVKFSEDGYTFDLYLEAVDKEHKPVKTREKLRKIGGSWNKERHAYVFMTSDAPAVKRILGDKCDIPESIDPTKTVTVSFTIRFQCNDIDAAQGALKQIGLQQNRQGHWEGDLSQVDTFRKTFS